MSEQSDLRLGAEVWSSDNKHIGDLAAVVARKETFQPEALIVRESRWFTGHLLSPGSALLLDEVAVPLGAVDQITRERVELALSADQVRGLPPYLSYRYAPVSAGQTDLQGLALLTTGIGIPALEEVAAKSDDEIEISPGEAVRSASGKELGAIKEVLIEGDVLVGVVLRPGGFFEHEVIMPRRLLARGDDLALFANLTSDDLERLEPFHPPPD